MTANGLQVVLIKPTGYVHAEAFAEIAETLAQGFHELGLPCRVDANRLQAQAVNILLGWHLLSPQSESSLPPGCILYNLEQLDERNSHLRDRLIKLAEAHELWDYSLRNIQILHDAGLRQSVQHVPIGSVDALTRIPVAPVQDIDVLFYGSVNERRQHVLEALQQAGLRVEAVFGVYGAARDALIARAKVVLNLHYYDSSIFEMVRVSYLWANRKAVVAECRAETELEPELRAAACFVPYDQLVSACQALVNNPQERQALADRGFQAMSERPEQHYLQRVLNGDAEIKPASTHCETNRSLTVGLILAARTNKGYIYSFGPLGIGYIAAAVRKHFPHIKVVIKENLDDLILESPDIIGISAQSETYGIAIDYAKKIKTTTRAITVIGGVHISMLPQSLDASFDVGVIGEGEFTFIDLLNSIIENNGLKKSALATIPGLCFSTEAGILQTASRPPIADLDALAPPNLEELPFNTQWSMVCIMSSRGCPYRCTFCVSEKFAKRYRFLPAEKVINDIERLYMEKGTRHIVFYDDLLIANKNRLRTMIDCLKAKNLLGKITFSCAVRANLVNEEICALLKELHVTGLGMGVESFSDKILQYYNKAGVTGAINQRAIDHLHAANIIVNPSIIFGAPVETKEDMLITLRKIYTNLRDGKIHGPTWSTLIPYPGTAVWEYAEKRGIVSETMDWNNYANIIQGQHLRANTRVGETMDWNNYANTIRTMYLCEQVPLEEFYQLMDEWVTKFSILTAGKKSGGTFVIPNIIDLIYKIQQVYPTIMARAIPEMGDELILQLGDGATNGVDALFDFKFIPEVLPSILHGEHVKPAILPVEQNRSWQACGKLAKANTDTYLFLCFSYPQGLDLSHADSLSLKITAPAEQRTNACLLVILACQDGSEFLVTTSYVFGQPCQKHILLAWRQFQRAAWSKGGNAIDLRHIVQIRVGWGGYYGEQNEHIAFTLDPLQVGMARSPHLSALINIF